MKIIYTITADCDPPPDATYEDDDLLSELEDAVAGALIASSASFSIEASKKVEL